MSIQDAAGRFWSHVDKTAECWTWTSSKRANGYGQFVAEGRNQLAHRFAWHLIHGDIPPGATVDHICRDRSCVRPGHLRLATKKQNAENRSAIGTGASGVRGVKWDRARSKWAAALTHNYRSINLGRFSTIEEAQEVVQAARLTYFTHSDPKEFTS